MSQVASHLMTERMYILITLATLKRWVLKSTIIFQAAQGNSTDELPHYDRGSNENLMHRMILLQSHLFFVNFLSCSSSSLSTNWIFSTYILWFYVKRCHGNFGMRTQRPEPCRGVRISVQIASVIYQCRKQEEISPYAKYLYYIKTD